MCGQLQAETLTGGPCRGSEKAMSRRQAPNTEELWWCLWADTGTELAAEGVSREDLQQLLCIPGQGVMHLVVLLREDAGMGEEVLRAAVQGTGAQN